MAVIDTLSAAERALATAVDKLTVAAAELEALDGGSGKTLFAVGEITRAAYGLVGDKRRWLERRNPVKAAGGAR